MFTTVGYFDRVVRTTVERIEASMGGNVSIVSDKKKETVAVDWEKNAKTVSAVQFQKVYSYKEFEQLVDSNEIVMDFVKAYRSAGEPKVVKAVKVVKVTKATKVEEPEVEELTAEEPKTEGENIK
jgi:hypothetical protein